MSENEPEHTHRVVRKAHHRSTDGPGPAERFEPGEPITPTEDELAAAPDRFEPIEEHEPTPPVSGSSSEPTEDTDESEDAESADESGANEAESDDESEELPTGHRPDADELTVEWVENADYDDLRSMASEFEGVNGNWGEDRLRAELADRAEG